MFCKEIQIFATYKCFYRQAKTNKKKGEARQSCKKRGLLADQKGSFRGEIDLWSIDFAVAENAAFRGP